MESGIKIDSHTQSAVAPHMKEVHKEVNCRGFESNGDVNDISKLQCKIYIEIIEAISNNSK